MSNIIVFDTANQPYYKNKIFDPKVAALYPGALAMCEFYGLAKGEGFEVVTADYIIENNINARGLVVISEEITPWTDRLEQRGALLGVLFSAETPSFAWRFYRDLKKNARRYKHAFLFPGSVKWLDPKSTAFHPFFFPQPRSEVLNSGEAGWEERVFMAMINSNIVRHVWRPSHWLASRSKPELRCTLYNERRKAARYFCKNEGFHLYGRHWEKKHSSVSKRDYLALLSCYKGFCQNKIETLANYKYVVCFENAVFPGYITEKIFDCFYAGSIPIYYGAPDVTEYIPKECFIDFRDYADYDALDKYLLNLSSADAEAYRKAASDFLMSDMFKPFSQKHFANQLLDFVKDCLETDHV